MKRDPLVSELKAIIDSYGGGVMALARKAGIFHNTLRNISRGNIKNRPKPETILKIATAASNKKTIVEVAQFYGGEIERALQGSFGLNFGEGLDHVYSLDVSNAIDDFYKYVAFKLCHKNEGIERQELELLLANIAVRKMDDIPELRRSDELVDSIIPVMSEKIDFLLEKGVLHQEKDGFLKTSNNESYIGTDLVLKYAPEMTIFVKTKNFSEGTNMLMEQWEYTNIDDLKRALKVYYAGMVEAHKILMGSEGDIPVQMISMFETITLDPMFGGQR